MKRIDFNKHPEAKAWLKEHADEFTPASFKDTYNFVAVAVVSNNSGERNAPLIHFAAQALSAEEHKHFNMLMGSKRGDRQRLVESGLFPEDIQTTTGLKLYFLRLKKKVQRAIVRHKSTYGNRTAILPSDLVPKLCVEQRVLRYRGRTETLYRVLHNGYTTWVDKDGSTFIPEVLEAMEHIDDFDCQALEVEEP